MGGLTECPPHFSQVLISMVYLPEAMPASFQATYTPVESAGTEAQIKHLSRLMATQMTAAGLGPGEQGLAVGCACPFLDFSSRGTATFWGAHPPALPLLSWMSRTRLA